MNGEINTSCPTRNIQAGDIKVLYDSGSLRYLRIGDEELLRGIYVALRDAQWGTFPPFISHEKVTIDRTGFSIEYKCQYKLSGSPIFEWLVLIEGNNQNEISYSIQGTALASFKKNRAGLCILHPTTHAGRHCQIISSDGQYKQSVFPTDISPHQPFKNIHMMQWLTPKNVSCKIIFEGDTFETEDQRNWTDASFKTYSTPLGLPFPVQLQRNDVIRQRVTFSAHAKRIAESYTIRKSPERISFDFSTPLTVPNIGTSLSADPRWAAHPYTSWIRQLRLDHCRIDLKLYDHTWQEHIQQGITGASLWGTKLKIALHITDSNQLIDFIRSAVINSDVIKEILFLGPTKLTSDDIIHTYVPRLKEILPYTKIGGGTDCYFAELNRGKIDASLLDFISFSINPQVHAFDNLTLIENMAAQYDAVMSASSLYPSLPIHVSPVTLLPRFNPDATQVYISGNMPSNSTPDPRQHSLFAAGWTLGSIKNLAASHTDSITYYEVVGDYGIIPNIPDSSPATISPVYLLLRLIGEFQPEKSFVDICPLPTNYTGILMQNSQKKRWIIANHLPKTQKILIDNLTKDVRLRKLEVDTWDKEKENPESFISEKGILTKSDIVRLGPFGIAILDEE